MGAAPTGSRRSSRPGTPGRASCGRDRAAGLRGPRPPYESGRPPLCPAAAERPIQAHDGEQLIALGLGEAQLGVEELALGVQDFEVTRHPAAIADAGQPGSVAQRDDERLLLDAELLTLAMLDERV